MNCPGMPGAGTRRLVAAAAGTLGMLNGALVLHRVPVLPVPALRALIPHAIVLGSRYTLLLAALFLLSTVGGLLHGKHQAWRVAVAATTISLIAHPLKRADLSGLIGTVAVLLLLLSTQNVFPARGDPDRVRIGVRWLVFGSLGVLLYGFAGLYLLDADFRHPVPWPSALENAVRLLFILPATTIEPARRHGAWFIDSVRLLALAVLFIGVWQLLRPVVERAQSGPRERDRVRSLLDQYATTSLAYFHLLPDKSYYFADDGRACISYRVAGGCAVALGEPVGAADARQAVARSFIEFCDLNGWYWCFHQVTASGASELASLGLRTLKIGEEAVVPVQDVSLAGKSFKHVRNVTNRLAREGYRVEELPRPLDDAVLDELQTVSDAWLSQDEHRERTFTLGCFDRDYLRETCVMVVRRPGDRVEAFVNILPSFRSHEGNFDLMRRRPDAPDGVMDYLFVALIERFRAEGRTGMNLGFAPLAGIDGNGIVARCLRILAERDRVGFNFQGLRTFKNKWQPRWEPRYLVYRHDVDLPRIAMAVVRVGERKGEAPWLIRKWLPSLRLPAARPPAPTGAPVHQE